MPYGMYTSRLYTLYSATGLITIPHLGVGLVLEMLSALIPSRSSYPTMPVFRQLAHQGSVPPGPLVLRRTPLKNQTLAQDRDRTVSRITSTITSCMDYIFTPFFNGGRRIIRHLANPFLAEQVSTGSSIILC